MITVKIGTDERSLESAHESWINQQINRRRQDGDSSCVRVRIEENGLNMILSTAGCPAGNGGGRPPNAKEKEVFDLWDRLGLNKPDFTGGRLVAFLKQLDRFLR